MKRSWSNTESTGYRGSTTVVELPPTKLLRIAAPPSEEVDLINSLETDLSSDEIINLLIRLESYRFEEQSIISCCCKILLKLLQTHFREPRLCEILLGVLRAVFKQSNEKIILFEDVLNCFLSESNIILKSRLLMCIQQSLKFMPCKNLVLPNLSKTCLDLIDASKHTELTQVCLKFLSSIDVELNFTSSDLDKIVSHVNSSNQKVRTSALGTLIHYQKFDLAIYQLACRSLDDDKESVRIQAVRLVSSIGRQFPLEDVKYTNCNLVTLTIANDAFSRVCLAVHDTSISVRRTAVDLLGNASNVDPLYLDQMFDKKALLALRRGKRDGKPVMDDSKSIYSSGRKFEDDRPVDENDIINLVPTAACGAFIHTLEDEYLEVRAVAVDSVCKLAQTHGKRFMSKALDFLIDTTNDEIESVRLRTIVSLEKLVDLFTLSEEQLETLLSGLDDLSAVVRSSLHSFLRRVCLNSKIGLKTALDALIKNLRRYPQDKQLIFNCLKFLGSNHPYECLALSSTLLGYHPQFDTPESDPEDAVYISVLILVLNGAKCCPLLLPLLPDSVVRHYWYLKDSMPDVIPPLDLGAPLTHTLPRPKPISQKRDEISLAMDRLDRRSGRHFVSLVVQDLERISVIYPQVSASADFICMYLRCLSKLSSNPDLPFVSRTVRQMRFQFVDLSNEAVVALNSLRLVAAAYSLESQRNWPAFIDIVKDVRSKLRDSGELNEFVTEFAFNTNQTLCNPVDGVSIVRRYLSDKPPMLKLKIDVGNDIKKKVVILKKPNDNLETSIKFCAGTVVRIHVEATVINCEANELKIRVVFPDTSVQLFDIPPFPSTSPPSSSNSVSTDIFLSSSPWSEPSCVKLCIVGFCDDDELVLSKEVRFLLLPNTLR